MVSGQETYVDIYSRKETDELLSLHKSGGLNPDACDDLETVLRNRGVEPPKRPVVSPEQREENPAGK